MQINGASQSDLETVFASVGPNPATGVVSGTLANNGGPAETIALADSAINPAIDAGDDLLAGVPSTDARGFARSDFPGVANNGASISDSRRIRVSNQIVVTTLDDTVDPNDGQTSLREALALANSSAGNVTITFDPSLSGGTLTLDPGLGLLKITANDITIDGDTNGDGTPDITISGGNNTAVLFTAINGNIHTTLDGLVIENGYASPTTGFGGGIFVGDHDSLTLTNSIIADNSAADGGGIFVSNQASLAMADSTVSDNAAVKAGGGIVGYSGATLALTNVTISGNSAAKGGGIIGTANDQITLADSTITGNKTTVAGGGGLYSSGASAVTTVTNSIVAGNSSASAGDDLDGHSGAKLVLHRRQYPRLRTGQFRLYRHDQRQLHADRRHEPERFAIGIRAGRRQSHHRRAVRPARRQRRRHPDCRAQPDRHCDRCRRHRRLAARHRDG